MSEDIITKIKCPKCKGLLKYLDKNIRCSNCDFISKKDKIIRYVNDNLHSNWGLQWNRFSKVQLDSYNSTNETETRLLLQSGLKSENFKGKNILEVGSGNGRFTEILLRYGANVVSLDYSRAIDANLKNNLKKGNVIFLQADIFNLPLQEKSFDIVICYGVIQHTGNNEMAIKSLMKYVKKNGWLTIDVYSNKLKYYNPFIYLFRPLSLFFNFTDQTRLNFIEKFVNFVFPLQLKILSKIKNKSYLKLLRFIINRSPNSVYGINLHLEGKISKELAYEWSVMDTFDSYGGKYDQPISITKFKNILLNLSTKYEFKIIKIDESGQGNYCQLLKK